MGYIGIIEDDELVREGLRDSVESAGYLVVVFASAEEFLDAKLAHPVDCLIVDIQLPGMSGLDLQRWLSTHTLRIPIIFVTAHGNEVIREEVLRRGASALFLKPFRREELLNAVKASIEQ
ncbi:MAG: response regulator [Bryobacteraceae bacterium]